ncbi:MAG TPA: ATP-binding protein, partial [Acidobacteriota bacterium]|nr:ATP-binding protein [Acidobacteriota bacterium]
VQPQLVPLSVVYAVCVAVTLASVMLVLVDRNNVASRERIRALFGQIIQSLEIGVLVMSRSGDVILVNEAGRRLMPGVFTTTQLVGYDVLLRNYPGVREIARSALEGGNYVKNVEHSLDPLNVGYLARITSLPLLDLQKNPVGVILLIDDVHEIAALESKMRAAEKLSVLGTLAATLAHEIRNPLAALDLNLELLGRHLQIDKRFSDFETKNRYFAILESEISRLSGVVNNFLSFARSSSETTGTVFLDRIIRTVVDLLENQANAGGVRVEVRVGAGPCAVAGYEDQLKQAFLNIIINGLDAMPQGGELTIDIGAAEGDDIAVSGKRVTVRVRDTGEGIGPELIGKLFDPFFSTRPQGTGLGLTIVNQIVRMHNGRIYVESEPGAGTVMTVELPAALPESGEQQP